jgi:hypothetical protein
MMKGLKNYIRFSEAATHSIVSKREIGKTLKYKKQGASTRKIVKS